MMRAAQSPPYLEHKVEEELPCHDLVEQWDLLVRDGKADEQGAQRAEHEVGNVLHVGGNHAFWPAHASFELSKAEPAQRKMSTHR